MMKQYLSVRLRSRYCTRPETNTAKVGFVYLPVADDLVVGPSHMAADCSKLMEMLEGDGSQSTPSLATLSHADAKTSRLSPRWNRVAVCM